MKRPRRRTAAARAPAGAASEALLDEQWRLVWSHSRYGSFAASAFAVLVAWKLARDIELRGFIELWLAAKLTIAAWRAWLGWHSMRPGHRGGRRWRVASTIWLALDGATWGVLGLLTATASVPLAAVIAGTLAGVSCAATFGLQVSVSATAAYVVPMIVPTMLALLPRGDDAGWIGGLGLAALLALQLTTALRSDRRQAASSRLAHDAQAMAREKTDALKLALRQSAVKTQFLANISHELRTPLHGILGIARLLRLDRLDAAAAHRVELIETSGVHLLALINDLLDISRVEAGQFVMRSEPFELGAQIEHVAGVYGARAEERGLVFEVSMHATLPHWIVGDPARFRQVLHNLLGNAIKFTEKGYVHLNVELDSVSGGVVCTVSDSGCGIDADEQAHIFEAFRQAGPASQQPSDGTGLGLTIARDIARAMGGDVTLQSTVGVGTSVRFEARLPTAAAPGDAPVPEPLAMAFVRQRREDAGDPGDHGARQARRHAALLVEDDDVNAMIAAAYLERFGIAVERARHGAEAVEAALPPHPRPDVILMDCRMPVMDGYEATRRIRAIERAEGLGRLPVIALTATAGDDERRQCLDAGMDDFLAKPYTGDQLVALVELWLERKQSVGQR